MRILVIEDHALIRDGIRLLLNDDPDLQITAEAELLAEALKLVAEQEFDLIITDLNLPDSSGVEAIKQLRAHAPQALVMVLTGTEETETLQEVLDAGCDSLITKQAGLKEVIVAIKTLQQGRSIVNLPSLRQLSVHRGPHIGIPAKPVVTPVNASGEPLSRRENEVLALLARGHSNQQVADQLFLSVKTIETYRSRLTKKLGVRDRAGLFEQATQLGLLNSDPVMAS